MYDKSDIIAFNFTFTTDIHVQHILLAQLGILTRS
jgi:hypothetical protein